jgi:hypothetical protein
MNLSIRQACRIPESQKIYLTLMDASQGRNMGCEEETKNQKHATPLL